MKTLFFILQKIIINGWGLKIVDHKAFCGLKGLKTLQLSRNKLTTPPWLRPVESTLRLLMLDENYLETFPSDYFQYFTRLSVINLSNNYLLALPNFCWLAGSLQVIYLYENRLVSLDGLTSQGHYIHLTEIYAPRNEITHLNVTHLKCMPNLLFLDLSKNNLTSLGDFKLYYDGTMLVKQNPWHCDADFSWLGGLSQATFSLTCFTPHCYAGKTANDLSKYKGTDP